MRALTPARIARPGQRRAFAAVDPADPRPGRLAWLAAEVLAQYGDPADDLSRVRAVRDWIARHAIHPYAEFHRNVPTGVGAENLPTGTERTDLIPLYTPTREAADGAYWAAFQYNGYLMLCRLLALDPATGTYSGARVGAAGPTAADATLGMMERVGSGHWRAVDLGTDTAPAATGYRFALCTYQDHMAMVLLAALGYHAMVANTYRHDPFAVWVPSLGRWVYECPTYNEEHYLVPTTGSSAYDAAAEGPLTLADLVAYSGAGLGARIKPRKAITYSGSTPDRWGPTYATSTTSEATAYVNTAYDANCTYLGDGHPAGWTLMGSQLNMRDRYSDGAEYGEAQGPLGDRFVQVGHPTLADLSDTYTDYFRSAVFAVGTAGECFPPLGCALALTPSGVASWAVRIETGQPDASHFERRVNGGSWEAVGTWEGAPPAVAGTDVGPLTGSDVLARGLGTVEYRSVDASGNVSSTASVTV